MSREFPLMRIEFVQSSRQGLEWSGGTLHIGSAAQHAVRLEGPRIAADHVALHADSHGLWLQVQPGAERVHVNARPVREYALLRLGDTISVGGHRMLLRAAGVAAADDAGDDLSGPSPAASIRAVAGPHSGRAWSVHEGLRLGHAMQRVVDADAPGGRAPVVSWRDRELWLEIQSGGPDAVSVNGVAMSGSTRLHHADCIGLGGQRFVVDGWSLMPGARSSDEPVTTEADAAPPDDGAGPRGEVWWLLLTAAALGLLIALFLLLHP